MTLLSSKMVSVSPHRELSDTRGITTSFHRLLREEVRGKNPFLSREEQFRLQAHYPLLLAPDHYPPELVQRVYLNRRAPAVKAILESEHPIVFDAGCGYGSESFLFASLGAKVLAVDISGKQIEIAQKRQRYFEESFGRPLNITFVAADLDQYAPEVENFSMTWLASVLAAIKNQDLFLAKVYDKTRKRGKVIVTDMNLLNPLFLWNEWRRRRRALRQCFEFKLHADFLAMFRRRGRNGARYFPCDEGEFFDDVQFFSAKTLLKLLESVGFSVLRPYFNGFLPPFLFHLKIAFLESLVARLPIVRTFGYFYTVEGVKR